MAFTQQELLARRSFLGASEAAAAVGMSQWYTPLQLYRSKKGDAEPIEETIPMMVGTALEPVVIRLFEREKKMKVTRQQERVQDPRCSYRVATIDGMASDGGIVQAKASGIPGVWGDADDDIPLYIIYQVHHEMICTGARHAWVPVLLFQREFRVYRIEYDAELAKLLIDKEEKFWSCVQTNTEPDPISEQDYRYLYPVGIKKKIVATPEILAVCVSHAALKQRQTKDETQEEVLKIQIIDFIKDADTLVDEEGNVLMTFKSSARQQFYLSEFRTDHPGLAEQYTKTLDTRVLLNKLTKRINK